MAAFTEETEGWYFGRRQLTTRLIATLAERVRIGGPLFVVGASGAGKSSMLGAGLLPAARQRGMLVYQAVITRHFVLIRGGDSRFDNVTDARLQVTPPDPSTASPSSSTVEQRSFKQGATMHRHAIRDAKEASSC